jgi:hypothetical protein
MKIIVDGNKTIHIRTNYFNHKVKRQDTHIYDFLQGTGITYNEIQGNSSAD